MSTITETQKKQFSLRPTPEIHERLRQAAAWQGQPLQAFVLGAAVEAADDVLTRRDKIELQPEDASLILSLLDSDAEPNDALKEAFRKRAEVLGE